MAHPPAFFFVLIVGESMLHFLAPEQVLHRYVTYLGLIPLALGIWLYIWGNKSARIGRHPTYLAMLSILIGEAILLGSVVSFLGPAMFVIVIELLIMRGKKQILDFLFGI